MKKSLVINVEHRAFWQGLQVRYGSQMQQAIRELGEPQLSKIIIGDLVEGRVNSAHFGNHRGTRPEVNDAYRSDVARSRMEIKERLKKLGVPDEVFAEVEAFAKKRIAAERPKR